MYMKADAEDNGVSNRVPEDNNDGLGKDDCSICYTQQDIMRTLTCCQNRLCFKCLDCLETPLCPYCRHIISDIMDSPRFRMSTSLPLFLPYSEDVVVYPIEVNELIPPVFDPESRIIRRHIHRIRQIRMREEDRTRNRMIRQQQNQNRNQRKQDIKHQVNEDLQFMFDDT